MPGMQETRRPNVLLRWLMLGLALAIFGWGLQAKLSLYNRESGTVPNTVAKIIQDGQVNKKAFAQTAVDRSHTLLVSSHHPVLIFRPRIADRQHRPAVFFVFADTQSYPPSHFFRPPPALL